MNFSSFFSNLILKNYRNNIIPINGKKLIDKLFVDKN